MELHQKVADGGGGTPAPSNLGGGTFAGGGGNGGSGHSWKLVVVVVTKVAVVVVLIIMELVGSWNTWNWWWWIRWFWNVGPQHIYLMIYGAGGSGIIGFLS